MNKYNHLRFFVYLCAHNRDGDKATSVTELNHSTKPMDFTGAL